MQSVNIPFTCKPPVCTTINTFAGALPSFYQAGVLKPLSATTLHEKIRTLCHALLNHAPAASKLAVAT